MSTRFKDIADNFTGSSVLGLLNVFSGGSLQRFAIFALDHALHHGVDHAAAADRVIPQLDKPARRARSGSRRSPSTRAT